MYQRKSTERHSAVSKKFIVLVIGTYGVSSTAIREISLLKELKDDNIVRQVASRQRPDYMRS